MPFVDDLRELIENQERQTVGSAFGGPAARTASYSVTSIRDWIINQISQFGTTDIERAIARASNLLSASNLRIVISGLIRFSFLIELTNLKIGSTKMKTRWVPGLIMMPQPNSFEPIRGSFEPGNDPRSSDFDECKNIFTFACNLVCDEIRRDPNVTNFLAELNQHRRVPYEFPLTYANPQADPVHTADNIRWNITADLRWLLRARKIFDDAPVDHKPALDEIKKAKIQVKVYKTDRALTGKDKTNRAKRWEVLAGDFQHATLEQCWSVEKKLTSDLVLFEHFPNDIKSSFIQQNLLTGREPVTRCPVTLEPLNYSQLSQAVLNNTHGVSDYQVGHLHPLKRGGSHQGDNVCWQSADGNRIQGNLSITETEQLLDAISARRQNLR